MNNEISIKDIKENDTLISMYFGESSEIRLLGDGQYIVAAYFPMEEIEVMYTEDGIPNWSCAGDKEQTAFLKRDIEKLKMSDFDFSALSKKYMLTESDLKNYKDKDFLKNIQVRTCIGMWRDALTAPTLYIEKVIENKEFHLFRKKPS